MYLAPVIISHTILCFDDLQEDSMFGGHWQPTFKLQRYLCGCSEDWVKVSTWVAAASIGTQLHMWLQLEILNEPTSVSGVWTNVYFLSSWTSASLTSSRASLMPIQLLGPYPKGQWLMGGRLAFSSHVNLIAQSIKCTMIIIIMEDTKL